MILAQDTPERVGNFTFTVRSAEPTPETQARWNDRVEALTNWLLAEWEREEKEKLEAA